jgi:hypothetical protein
MAKIEHKIADRWIYHSIFGRFQTETSIILISRKSVEGLLGQPK